MSREGESTCSGLDMRLDMGGIPIGVMSEKGMPTACIMIAVQWELLQAVTVVV